MYLLLYFSCSTKTHPQFAFSVSKRIKPAVKVKVLPLND